MKLVKIVSIIIFVGTTSFDLGHLKPMEMATSTMESATDTTDTLILEIFKSNSFDMCGPRQLLKSIKALQEKKFPTTVIAKALKVYFKAFGESMSNITCFLHRQTINILDFLDDTCTRDTVTIILTAFQTEEEACSFIMRSSDNPSGLELMLRNKNYECALPMIELLSKNNIRIKVVKHNLFNKHKIKTLVINDIINNAKKESTLETTDEMLLLAVIIKLRKYLNPDATNPKYWLKLSK